MPKKICIACVHSSVLSPPFPSAPTLEQAALAERNRIRRAEEAEEARKAAVLAAERMRLRKQKLLRLEDPQGQLSSCILSATRSSREPRAFCLDCHGWEKKKEEKSGKRVAESSKPQDDARCHDRYSHTSSANCED